LTSPRRAIVTGASSGIGRETAIAFAEAGMDVVLASRSGDALRTLETDLCERGLRAVASTCDVRQIEEVERLVEMARARGRGVEPVCVHAAGVAWFGGIHEVDARKLREQIETNLLGAIHLFRSALPWMLEEGRGTVVSIASVAAEHAFPGAAAYCASKAGLRMLARTLAAEFADRGLRFLTVMPGAVDTPLWDFQPSAPPREDMLSSRDVARTILRAVLERSKRRYDELSILPPKGIL